MRIRPIAAALLMLTACACSQPQKPKLAADKSKLKEWDDEDPWE